MIAPVLACIGVLCAQIAAKAEVRIGPCCLPAPPDYVEPQEPNGVLIVASRDGVSAQRAVLEPQRSTLILWEAIGAQLALELSHRRVDRMLRGP